MMSKTDKIIGIRKSDNTLRIALRHREQVLQNRLESDSQLGIEIIKDQMWILFTHSPTVWDIVSHYSVGH